MLYVTKKGEIALKNKQKFNVKKILGIYIFIIIMIPLILYFFVDLNEVKINNIDQSVWLTFWGTYIGACLGTLATVITLIFTFKHYEDEAEEVRELNEKRRLEEKEKYYNDVKRELLVNNRPYLVIEDKHSFPKTGLAGAVNKLERFVYTDKERPLDDLYEVNEEFYLKIKNVGNGPALNININYSCKDYLIDGFNDSDMSKRIKDAPKILTKMTYDVANGEEKYFLIKLRFSAKAIDNTQLYRNTLTFSIIFEDICGEKISKIVTVDLNNKTIMGYENQIYENPKNQQLLLVD